MRILEQFYSDTGDERVGFVIGNNIIEVPNISQEPEEGFMVRTEDILRYAETADATWHTHPNASANLSQEDFVTVNNWPEMKHFIIGKDGVKCFQYNKKLGAIVEIKEDG